MALVTVKTKYQVTIPQKLREELGIDTGDLLEAEVQDGKLVFTPKEVVDREAAFARMDEIGKEARKRWEADGLTDEDIERMIQEEVNAVRYGEPSS